MEDQAHIQFILSSVKNGINITGPEIAKSDTRRQLNSTPSTPDSHGLESIWNVSKLRSNQKIVRTSSVKAVYSGDYPSLDKNSRQGIWSIREDVQVPSSPYFPTYAQDQGPPPMMQERFQSVISQLFQYVVIIRVFGIRCGGAVDDDMANIIVAQLLYLHAVDPNKYIVMYVNSPGGSVTAGMAIFDTMKHIRPDVSTVCVGLAARLMKCWHHKANLNGYLAYDTGQSIDRINQDTDRNYFMSAKESKEYGLIDGVIMNPLKALQPLAAA
ncbi:putative endopeptidase Clp [Helianthus annuus]|nr:putative endopeptidase Clp [Helianthus annuus]